MTTAANYSLADNIVRTKLPNNLDAAGWVTQAAELRALPRIDSGTAQQKATKLADAMTKLDGWEAQIYAHPDRGPKIDSRWADDGDQTLVFFSQAQINALQADDDTAKKFLKLTNRMVGYANCKKLAELALNPNFAPVSLPVPTRLPGPSGFSPDEPL